MDRRKMLLGGSLLSLVGASSKGSASTETHKSLHFIVPAGVSKLIVNSQDKDGKPTFKYTLSVEPGQVFNIYQE